jgi:secondary thiamine-phosphate synthase enzyme
MTMKVVCTEILIYGLKSWHHIVLLNNTDTNLGEDNADAHLKRQIMGREVVVAVTNGKLDFGPWEQIFYGEFDGQRNKRVLVKVIGE